MATTTQTTLYPPSLPTTMPACSVKDSGVKVYFSISGYNTKSEIKKIHISVKQQNNNVNVLNVPMYIAAASTSTAADGRYYITIPTSYFQDYAALANKFLSIQVRFDNSNNTLSDNTDTDTVSKYINENLNYFSEWSKIGLLKIIYNPILTVNGQDGLAAFDIGEKYEVISSGELEIQGNITFEDDDNKVSTEFLSSYQISLVDANNVYYTSDIIYNEAANTNTFTYNFSTLGLGLKEGTSYAIYVDAYTNNNYHFTQYFMFMLGSSDETDTGIDSFTYDFDDEDGIITITVNVNENSQNCYLYVRRTCDISKFTTWDLVGVYEVKSGTPIDSNDETQSKYQLIIKDNTVNPNNWYEYALQLRELTDSGSVGDFHAVQYVGKDTENTFEITKFFPTFDKAIISDKDKQLALEYDWTVSSVSPTRVRTISSTLGSKYPKITQNGVINYKVLSVSGTISSQVDDNELFISKTETLQEDCYSEYYNPSYDLHYPDEDYPEEEKYKTYNNKNWLRENDDLWERRFRDAVLEWLDNGQPKLYRSQDQQAMCVVFSGISLTPKKTLSNRLYDFSATMYEIEDGNNLNTLNKLNIFEVVNDLPQNNAEQEVVEDNWGSEETSQTIYTTNSNMKYFQLYRKQMKLDALGLITNDYKRIVDSNNLFLQVETEILHDISTKESIREYIINRLESNGDIIINPDSLYFNTVKIIPKIKSENDVKVNFLIYADRKTGEYTSVSLNNHFGYNFADNVNLYDVYIDNLADGDNIILEFAVFYKFNYVTDSSNLYHEKEIYSQKCIETYTISTNFVDVLSANHYIASYENNNIVAEYKMPYLSRVVIETAANSSFTVNNQSITIPSRGIWDSSQESDITNITSIVPAANTNAIYFTYKGPFFKYTY